ncbi:17beta-estradiol 17-dehydrogenase / very-long-chain 3-oxoacyl-CoA reductase [Nematocida sp. ERTm5]|nr:17beta-estradiol 17-dehydrogenase / very-long-chain 3-oxoacyl-CoA reductase [Nematocida sp. ERTm5]
MLTLSLKCIGGAVLFVATGNTFFALFMEICAYFIRRLRNRSLLKELSGKWAIITGCTDGIGLGIAREMANNGINLILISRTQEKLDKVEEELSKKVKTKTVQMDFENEIDFAASLAEVKEYSPHILVNNVGVAESGPTAFMEHTFKSIDRIVKVNITNTVRITQEYISWDKSPKDKKYILTTGSMLGSIPSPFQQIYAGTKAFLQVWSESISTELPGYHAEVFMTGLVCSKLSGAKKPNLFVPSADLYGKCCVHTFGTCAMTYPYFPHALLNLFACAFPRGVIGMAMAKFGVHIRKIKQKSGKKK